MSTARAPYLTVKDVAALLRLSEKRIYQLVADGTLPHFRLGASIRFDPEELDRSLKPHDTDSRSQEAL